ncbi:MAG TPA: plasmid pRiA4b ORF-3 family protein [Candidatus Hydrogenedentes bacterium]|nr:MAG: Plasmid pRiA4b ORF-3-like protein [Candidatus Hydrogenedentes bacterium ADurb.Bin101]HOC69903.1 plasmid pRiA4b ORF-3 family protein [Candidatus Hydrogenedentota bacterium]HQN00751.1 plasmid pRiA4b ORF-3 family protein [Candidatus Hydrogenedentota bacterium]
MPTKKWSPPPEMTVPMYELMITLSDLPIWRRVLVRGDMNLGLLHAIIQVAMGWTNSHLHQFIIKNKFYTDLLTCDELDTDSENLDEEEAVLRVVAPKENTRFYYEYDFGDSWDHTITVEKIHKSTTPPKRVAECLDGSGACPPEDCGGIGGYADLLEIIQDPSHKEYEPIMVWLGGGFDPDAFDLATVNKYLRKVKYPRMTEDQLAKVLMERDGY